MPIMDGLEAARRIARVSHQTTIVMFTLHHCEQVLRDAEAAAVQHVLSKMDGGVDTLLALLTSISESRKPVL
jgi:DNA-binding NarL/FixJ family response regulator